MEDAVDELEDGIDELNGAGLSRQLKSANRFDAQIDSLTKTLQRLADAGFETSEFEEKLADAQDFLARIEETVREGDKEAAEDLIDEFEELIDELKDDIAEATEDPGKPRGSSSNQGRGRSQGRGRGSSGEDDAADDDDVEVDDDEEDSDDDEETESMA
jgi:molecular chaperone GrpE (heat shock protein)